MTAFTQTAEETDPTSHSRAGKYVTFKLASEEYGLPILKVREIISLMDITTVPGSAPHIRGVINLRGQVISVIDLRRQFQMPPAGASESSCIIVTEVSSSASGSPTGKSRQFGVVVDRVCEVLAISENDVEDAPELGVTPGSNYVLGMAKVGKNVKILLDIDRVLGALPVPTSQPESSETPALSTAA